MKDKGERIEEEGRGKGMELEMKRYVKMKGRKEEMRKILFEGDIRIWLISKYLATKNWFQESRYGIQLARLMTDERGDVPGWVLVVLMTTGLITAIWAIAEPRLATLLRNSLDSMNNVR